MAKSATKYKGRAAVYRVYSNTGRLLYVGCSIDPIGRMGAHGLYSEWSKKCSYIEIRWFPTLLTARLMEGVALERERPIYNKNGSTFRK